MDNKDQHRDAFEQFYQSTFDDVEMDIPAGLTDSILDKVQTKPAPKTFSERLGAGKLYRILQVSLAFNLVTISLLSYYIYTGQADKIIIETPIKQTPIEATPKTRTQPSIKDNSMENSGGTKVSAQKTNKPSIDSKKTKKSVKPIVADSIKVTTQAPIVTEQLDSVKQTVPVTPVDSMKTKATPTSLEDLRKQLQDTSGGQELFDEK